MLEDPEIYYRTKQAANYVKRSVSNLDKLRVFGGGPKFIKAGRLILYKREDLDEWLNSRVYGSTSEYQK